MSRLLLIVACLAVVGCSPEYARQRAAHDARACAAKMKRTRTAIDSVRVLEVQGCERALTADTLPEAP